MTEDLFDETIYSRVTDVLSIVSSFSHVPKKILEYAQDRGKRVHDYCELYSKGLLKSDIDLDCVGYVQAFINFFDENIIEVIKTEDRTKCDFLKIQGKFDLIARVKDREGLCIIDIKTSSDVVKTWRLQLAAYQHLCSSYSDIDYFNMSRIVLQIDKESNFGLIEYSQDEFIEDFKAFKSILEVYNYFKLRKCL